MGLGNCGVRVGGITPPHLTQEGSQRRPRGQGAPGGAAARMVIRGALMQADRAQPCKGQGSGRSDKAPTPAPQRPEKLAGGQTRLHKSRHSQTHRVNEA